MKENIHRQWFNGPLVHLHLRSEHEEKKYLDIEKHQFTQIAAIKYLDKLLAVDNATITDTNHAFLFQFDKELIRPENIDSEQWKTMRIRQASDSTLDRLNFLKEKYGDKNILFGAEADILDKKGRLSLTDTCLSKLDVVISSFHYGYWKSFSEIVSPSIEDILEGYENAVKNPNTDILGHPTALTNRLNKDSSIQANCFGNLLGIMKEKQVAFEIPFNRNLSLEENKFTIDVINLAKKIGTPFVIGLDFHHFEYLPFASNSENINEIVSDENIDEIFKKNSDYHTKLFRYLAKNIKILEQIGVTHNDILNSNHERFNSWLNTRRSSS